MCHFLKSSIYVQKLRIRISVCVRDARFYF